jgi:NAD(P)-dependent dehydrogenase (short-subunit alcohol dehydrogenase family)
LCAFEDNLADKKKPMALLVSMVFPLLPLSSNAILMPYLQACDKGTSTSYTSLISTVSKDSPNTKIIGYPFNVAKEEETLSLIDDVLNSWGRLDVWVCSSGLLGPPSLEATTPADLQKCFEVNSMAPFFALKYAPPAMAKTTPKQAYPNAAPKDQRYGSIIVVSSVASIYGGRFATLMGE